MIKYIYGLIILLFNTSFAQDMTLDPSVLKSYDKMKAEYQKRKVLCETPGAKHPEYTNSLVAETVYCTETLKMLATEIEIAEKNEAWGKDDPCAKDDYKDCYRGIKWAENATQMCKGIGVIETVLIKEVNSPTGFSGSNVLQSSELLPLGYSEECDAQIYKLLDKYPLYLGFGQTTERIGKCDSITINDLLVGRYKSWQDLNEDKQYLLLNEFKTKYGKESKVKKCHVKITEIGSIEIHEWENTSNGFNVALLLSKKGRFPHSDFSFARYIKSNVIEKAIESINKLKKEEAKIQSDKEEKEIKSIGKDI